MSCLLLAQIENPTVGFFASTSVNFALAYWSISIATTLLLTVLIVCRLLFMRYKLRKVLSADDRNSPYTSLSAMLIESAFLYAVTALIFIITFAKNDPVQNLVLPVLGQVQVWFYPLKLIDYFNTIHLTSQSRLCWSRWELRKGVLGPKIHSGELLEENPRWLFKARFILMTRGWTLLPSFRTAGLMWAQRGLMLNWKNTKTIAVSDTFFSNPFTPPRLNLIGYGYCRKLLHWGVSPKGE